MEFRFRNVNDAFAGLVKVFATKEYGDGTDWERSGDPAPVVRRESRNGPVLMIDEPVLVTYERPTERVLFNAARDANPFMHLYEALYMLAGRNDVAPLAWYAKQMWQYSDDGETLNGAYGYRWRKHLNVFRYVGTGCQTRDGNEIDQLDLLVAHLKADPTSRRSVLQMWNVEDDLLKIGAHPERSGNFYNEGLALSASKDVCCNLSVMFAVRIGDKWPEAGGQGPPAYFLDMTVTNRSNDLVWGLLGANYVHFSVLQEYVAARLGVGVGKYHHFSNNIHVYTETNSGFKPAEWLEAAPHPMAAVYLFRDDGKEYRPFPLVRDPAAFEAELPAFVEHHSGTVPAHEQEGTWDEPFLQEVAGPMLCAFACHKAGDTHSALMCVDGCAADDWRLAGTQWLNRRAK